MGAFVRRIREQRGLTQADVARALKTSQSAIVRMEKGGQNMGIDLLRKLGDVLDRKIVSVSDAVDFEIHGGRPLHGNVVTYGSKNGALGLLFASLLNRGTTVLHNIPRIEEVFRILEVFQSIGVQASWKDPNTIEIHPPKTFDLKGIDAKAAGRTRSVVMLLGSMIHRFPSFEIPSAGGCRMGMRTIAAHRYGLEALGVKITSARNAYMVRVGKLKPADIVMYESSDTAAENLLMAAALIPGVTTIRYAPPNYQVQDVCFFLEALGVKIEGIGTTVLTVHGVKEINRSIEWWNSEDPIEAMMFVSAAVTTRSELTILRCPIRFVELELLKLRCMGVRMNIGTPYLAKNGRTELVDLTVYPSKLRALHDKIHAQPYPGINSDSLPFFVPIATQATGATLIHDWMWENRAIYFTELNRLGANVTLADPHRVFVHGATSLTGAQVVCPPALRPAVIILIAMLAAEGTSILRNVYSIARGYEEIAARLNAIGADIRVIKGLA
ncbi:UDP-N-acetylglucosamine 1-carboxyvinyltransferase [Candidatus Uhrbacteria bacterium]|nr:UDP-N-acetylglucosamine 1-carboxyvinyltransferase [Candidatus Uhrbacteria bacterium]